jgi:uroporphyrinogen decarboxylase
MTGFKRITDTLNAKATRPIPKMLHCFMTAASESGITQAEYRSDASMIARTHIDFAKKYSMDGILLDVDTCMEAGAIGVPVDLPEHEPGRITTGLSGGLEACIDAMDPDSLIQDDRIKIFLEAIHLAKKEVGNELLVRGNADQGPFSLAMLSVGIVEFMMMLTNEALEEKLKVLLERALEVHLAYHRLIMDAGADITSFGDSSCGPDLISRDMYMRFSHPYHKRLNALLAGESITTICHICGNLDLILDDVISAGFPAIEADYKTDIAGAARKMSGKAVLFGPIDPSSIFYSGTPEEVGAATRDVIQLFPSGGLVIGAGCALPSGTPEENIRAFVETVDGLSGSK